MDPTIIAQRKDFRGWLMRNVMSYSPEQAANSIRDAIMAGGSREIVLTLPAIATDRLMGICPPLAFAVARRVPKKFLDNTPIEMKKSD
jgi:hypothetical protein